MNGTTSSSTATAALPHVPEYRLTRRGRLVVFAVALLAVLAAGVWLAQGSVATAEPGAATEVVVVDAGQTLWDIAAEVAEGDDVRDAVEELKQLNGLDSSMVTAGQRLRVPAA